MECMERLPFTSADGVFRDFGSGEPLAEQDYVGQCYLYGNPRGYPAIMETWLENDERAWKYLKTVGP